MPISTSMHRTAIEFISTRYPKGWGGAAVVRTETGKLLISVAPETKNDGLSLCMEVGAYLEAHKLNEAVTHSLCVCREDENSKFIILTPCGICQERLVHWGGDVLAAISNPKNEVIFKPIRELQPHHWSQANGENL